MPGSRVARWRYRWRRLRSPGGVNAVRRMLERGIDRGWVLARRRWRPPPSGDEFDGEPRLALLTVNFHTTHDLKLLLLTLCEQELLGLVHRIVVCDQASRDGGPAFLRELARRVDRLELVECRRFRNHARGLRACVRELDRVEAGRAADERANLLLCSDTDVVFRNTETLADLAGTVLAHDAALVGEIRRGPNPLPDIQASNPLPDIQASFFVIRRDAYARRSTVPFVNHGSPAYLTQRSIWDAGLPVVHFPSNVGGFVLHKGRGAVMATRAYAPHDSHGDAPATAHFIGVTDGARIWAEIEARYADLLEPSAQARLLDVLAERLEALGTVVVTD